MAATDPYNWGSWIHEITRADKDKDNLADQRYVLNKFLSIYPTASRQWKYYIELEMHAGNLTNAQQLFSKCLRICYDVELYQIYLLLVSKVNHPSSDETLNKSKDGKNKNKNKSKSKNKKDKKEMEAKKLKYFHNMVEAYEFALDAVGQDVNSTVLWRNYIDFLKNQEKMGFTSKNFDSGDAMLKIRKVYQRCVLLPINEVSKLWDEFMQWEQQRSKHFVCSRLFFFFEIVDALCLGNCYFHSVFVLCFHFFLFFLFFFFLFFCFVFSSVCLSLHKTCVKLNVKQ